MLIPPGLIAINHVRRLHFTFHDAFDWFMDKQIPC